MQSVIEQTKELTKRQVNFLIVLVFSVFPFLHFALKHFQLPTDILFLEHVGSLLDLVVSILAYLSYFSYFLWIATVIRWLIRNKAYKGLNYAFKHWRSIQKIRRMFLDAHYFVNRIYFGKSISEPLKVKLDYFGNGEAKLQVENHLKFDNKLDGAPISSALGSYVIESSYISKNNNFYVYDLLDSSIVDSQNVFESFADYKKWCEEGAGDYDLKIDDRVTLKYGHFLLVGKSGSGKTYATYHLLLHAQLKPTDKIAQFHICDPKGSSLMSVGEKLCPETTPGPPEGEASNFSTIKDEIEKVYNILLERQKVIKPRLDKEKLDADYSDFGIKPIVLVIDEWGALSSKLSAEGKKEESRNIVGMVNEITFMGRQLGVFVWIIMQQANAKALTTDIRDNMMFRTVLGNSEPTTYTTAFSLSEGSDVPKTKKDKGIGVYRYDGSAKSNLSLLAFPYLKFDFAKEFERFGGNKHHDQL